jgi:Zn-dependent M28 family amino/carboxypeptidase
MTRQLSQFLSQGRNFRGVTGFTGSQGGTGFTGSQGGTGFTGSRGSSVRYLQLVAVEKSTALENANDIVGAVEVPVSGTINTLRAKTNTGTATVAFKINGSSIGSVSANTTGVDSSISSSVTANDDLTLDVSSANGTGLFVTLVIQES